MKKRILLFAVLAAIACTSYVQAGSLDFTTCPFPASDLEKRVILTSVIGIVEAL